MRGDNSFCLIYEPVYYDWKASEIDKLQNDRNNAAYECLCERNIDICEKAGI